MTDFDELGQTLRVVEQRLRPTPEERNRARTAMRRELQDTRSGEGRFVAPVDELDVEDHLDLGVVRLADRERADRKRPPHVVGLLVAASILAVVAIAAAVLTRQGPSELATDVSPSTTSELPGSFTSAPAVLEPAIRLAREQVDTVLAPDRYSAVLDGIPLSFDISSDQRLIALEDDRVRLLANDPGVGPAPKELTIAILHRPFGGGASSDWLEANDVGYFQYFATASGRRAIDYELELSSPLCDPLAPCLDIAHDRSAAATEAPLQILDGPNRLLVLELSSDRALVVLDTSGGNRSGSAQVRYNTIVASLEVGDG